MKSNPLLFVCSQCSHSFSKWFGQCPKCQTWNSIAQKSSSNPQNPPLLPLASVSTQKISKLPTGIREFDSLIGGGIVPNAFVLLGGEPGIGKSTFLLQISSLLAKYGPVIYQHGEESAFQIKLRSQRLQILEQSIFLLENNDVQTIQKSFSQVQPIGIVVDSVQTVFSTQAQGLPGSLTQMKEVAHFFLNLSKKNQIFVFLIGHITKEGNIAGPKALEHIVDIVLYFEREKHNSFRILRSYKNRFGPTDQIGVFSMSQKGIQQVDNPSIHFIKDYNPSYSGNALSAIYEGHRPLLLEIQALVTQTHFALPRRMVDGTDINILHRLIAILEKNLNFVLAHSDIYVNITGGIRTKEPGIELPILMAIYSSFKKYPFKQSILFIGEVGLSGEIRKVHGITQRVHESLKIGIQKIFLPKKNQPQIPQKLQKNMTFLSSIQEILDLF